MNRPLRPSRALALLSLGAAAACGSAAASASRQAPGPAMAATTSAPITDVRYELAFDGATAREREVKTTMTFTVSGTEPVLLSLPAWTPGAYEISNFARWVLDFAPTQGGRPLAWDKVDYDTWRVRPSGAGEVAVAITYRADQLDNAMAWTQPDFALVNGTNVFLFPEGRDLGFPSTVTVRTEPAWRVATGMTATGPRSFRAPSYHDLVDMPFFIGRFDFDSVRVDSVWMRLATYPEGSVMRLEQRRTLAELARMFPPLARVTGDVPFATYTVMQIADSSYQGASGLEHQNSHVDVVTPFAIGQEFMPSLYAHEIFHAWNVKRLRPADMTPYVYARPMPTPWLWVSEGITDYYADLALVRGGLEADTAFYRMTAAKIDEVAGGQAVALEDASLSTWIHPVDGTGYIYYPKGSLAGFLLDIMIRDASDNASSLDAVMRELYRSTYLAGRGFTGDDWWGAVERAAGGRSFAEVRERYIDGREPFPWETVLPLAGLRLVADSTRRPELSLNATRDDEGVVVLEVEPDSYAARAGLREGDHLLSLGGISLEDPQFGEKFEARYGAGAETTLPATVRRDGQTLQLSGALTFRTEVARRIVPDPAASAKAVRVREGILRGTTR